MQIIVWNRLDHDVHLTVVMHSPLALEFIITPYRVPVPTGHVLHRDTIEPEMAANMTGASEDIAPRIAKYGFDEPFCIYMVDGRKIGPMVDDDDEDDDDEDYIEVELDEEFEEELQLNLEEDEPEKEPDLVFILRRGDDYDDEEGVERLEEG